MQATTGSSGQLDGECPPTPTQGGVVRNRQVYPGQLKPRAQEALRCPQRQVIDRLHRQGALDRGVRILILTAAFARLGSGPDAYLVFRNPDGDVPALYPTGVILAPVLDPIFDLLWLGSGWFLLAHPSTLAHIRSFMQQSPTKAKKPSPSSRCGVK